jgi:hypothetical protein
VVVNSFDKKLQKWKNPLKVSEKFKNYHNCTLKTYTKIFRLGLIDQVLIHSFSLPFVNLAEASIKRDDYERNFIEIFAQQGNYQIKPADNWNPKYDLEPIDNYVSDNQLEHFTIIFREFLENYHWGSDFYEECYVLILSPPQAYTSYEKMILPFDTQSWGGILITFGVGFFVIVLSRLKFQNFHNLLVGENVKTPSLNLIMIFFGNGMTKLPENNFARIVLAVFIYFCLIIRTGYQGEILKN